MFFLKNTIACEKRLIFHNGIIAGYEKRFETLIDSRVQVESSHDIEVKGEEPVAAIQETTQDAAKLLSIIIPAYNEGDDDKVGPNHVRFHQANPKESPVKKFLEYITRLELPQGTEIIVVNNNSQDNTIECVERFYQENEAFLKELKIHFRFVNASDQGVAHARNTGIYLAKGKHVLFLDADTEGFVVQKGKEKE